MHVCSFINLRNCTRCDVKSQLKTKRERLSESKIIRLLMQHYESFAKIFYYENCIMVILTKETKSESLYILMKIQI